MTDDIKALRAALDAGPTPGPWEIDESADVGFDIRSEPRQWLVVGSNGAEVQADAQYIAACHPERIARLLDALEVAQKDAALVRAQAEAEAAERLSIIADELIAGLGEPGRGLAEMIREGVVWIQSYAADVVWKVRRQALEDAAKACNIVMERPLQVGSEMYDMGRSKGAEDCAAAIRALKVKP